MADTRHLGASGVEVSSMGVGTWAWGDKGFWQYGSTHNLEDCKEAFRVSLEAGLNFFDTAEIYGRGESERILGSLVKGAGEEVKVATKYFPLPTRLKPTAIINAFEASLQRLGLEKVDLYMIHQPFSLIRDEDMMPVLAGLVKSGRVGGVGVSNYSAKRMRKVHGILAKHGVPLASNQIQYNLLYRKPESNGLLQTCRELNVALVAYSPLAMGMLTGKYSGPSAKKVQGMRRFTRFFRSQEKVQPVIDELEKIANARGKTCAQVALNWLLCKDELIIPIPGAKNAHQAQQNAGAMGWRLTDEEVARLDLASYAFLK